MSDKQSRTVKQIINSEYMFKFYILAGVFLFAQAASLAPDLAMIAVVVQIFCGFLLLAFIVKDRSSHLAESQARYEKSEKHSEKLQNQIRGLDQDLARTNERTREQELALEKQLKLNDFPLSDHFKVFLDKLKATDADEIEGLTHTQFMELYLALEETFKRNNRLPLSRLADIPEDVRRVNQIETLIDLYGKKMQKVREDGTLDEEDRDHKIANWERLMERDISRLEES